MRSVMPPCYIGAMSALSRNKPLQYVAISFKGEPPGRPSRVLWHIRAGPAQGPDGPRGWCVTEPCPEEVTVKFLAMLLNVKPFKVVADLLNLAISPSSEQTVPFEKALELLRHHGYTIQEV